MELSCSSPTFAQNLRASKRISGEFNTMLPIIVLLSLPIAILSECCPKEIFFFDPLGFACWAFGAIDRDCRLPAFVQKSVRGQSYMEEMGLGRGTCEIGVCGNGKPPKEGTYCGVGSCNMFSCNFDDGCIPGDAIESFSRLHPASWKAVWNFEYAYSDMAEKIFFVEVNE